MSEKAESVATPETVEQLVISICCIDLTCVHTIADMERVEERIAHFLRSHNIDPATMQPTEKQQPADDAHRERGSEPEPDVEQLQKSMDDYGDGKFRSVQEVIDELKQPAPPQPTEPVVTESDRELAIAVASYCIAGVLPPVDLREVARIIAKARQAEREERIDEREELLTQLTDTQAKLTAAEAELESLTTMRAAICIQNENYEKMRQRLTAAEARVRELDELYQRERDISGRALVEVGVCTRTMHDSAGTLQRMAQASLDKFRQQPATADAKGGCDC